MGLRLLVVQRVMCTIPSKTSRIRMEVVDPILPGGYSSDAKSFVEGAFFL